MDSAHTEIKELDLLSDQQLHGTPDDIYERFPCPGCSSHGDNHVWIEGGWTPWCDHVYAIPHQL